MMKHIGKELFRTLSRTRATERGELMKYFCERLNGARRADGFSPIGLPRMGHMLAKIPTKDLYYIKSECDHTDNFSKRFWYLLDPKKYEDKNKKRPLKK